MSTAALNGVLEGTTILAGTSFVEGMHQLPTGVREIEVWVWLVVRHRGSFDILAGISASTRCRRRRRLVEGLLLGRDTARSS